MNLACYNCFLKLDRALRLLIFHLKSCYILCCQIFFLGVRFRGLFFCKCTILPKLINILITSNGFIKFFYNLNTFFIINFYMDIFYKKISVYLLLSFFHSTDMEKKVYSVHYIARHTIENVSKSHSWRIDKFWLT